MKALIFLVGCMLTTMISHAQNITEDTISWTSGSSIDMRSSAERTSSSTIVTYPQNRIQLIQGSRTRELDVMSREGSWSDVSLDGFVVFIVRYGQIEGILRIEKAGDITSALLDFSDAAVSGIKQKFIINSIETR